MNRLLLFLLALLVADLAVAGTNDQIASLQAGSNDTARQFYARFDLPATHLPAGCSPSDLSPVEKTARPLVLASAKHIKSFCEEDFPDLLDYSVTREMFILSFKEKNDIGIYGWRLASPETASALFAKGSAKYSTRTNQMKLWLHKDFVVLLWRDDGVTDACFKRFEDHVRGILDNDKNLPIVVK
jgi:hypothetical protein